MPRVTIYSTQNCSICAKAKSLLNKWRIEYSDIRIDHDDAAMKEFCAVTQNAKTVPQILIDGKLIGGFSELTELHMDGELDKLIKSE